MRRTGSIAKSLDCSRRQLSSKRISLTDQIDFVESMLQSENAASQLQFLTRRIYSILLADRLY